MGLKDLRLPKSRVDIPGDDEQYFEVRGLSFVDMRSLLVKHSTELSRLFDLVANGNGVDPLAIASAAAAAGQFLDESPALAAEVIAMSSGEPDEFETVLMLPFPVQVDALTKIGKLTFATEDSVKKFLQTVRSLIRLFKESPKS